MASPNREVLSAPAPLCQEGREIPAPRVRLLRVFAYDPSLATDLENYDVSEVLVRVPWETDRVFEDPHRSGVLISEAGLLPGPVGDYLEIIDVDPASRCAYAPVDLNHPHILAQNGLPPSEGNPQFHQQMVYAVAMTTIQNFERALGRQIFWQDRLVRTAPGRSKYVATQRLRMHPHALRDENAYYDPDKKAVLFGYFPAHPEITDDVFPGGMIFSCLSHDIVAHETTHAILDGMQRYFLEPSNADTLAFHEAFADLVALFQHFSFPEILKRQIAQARGDLDSETLLGQLAVQFGKATGRRGALRDAIGGIDPSTGKWALSKPDPNAYSQEEEPHARGALLVATIFDAFRAVYRHRTRDLIRIATGGTGVLPPGSLHPDLVERLATEAAKAAQHLLLMCIRAIDYCPPVDVNFGDYLRALITADSDFVQDDAWNYRVALIESFRSRGIYPKDVRTLSIESLRWQPADEKGAVGLFCSMLRPAFFSQKLSSLWEEITTGTTGRKPGATGPMRKLTRMELYRRIKKFSAGFHASLEANAMELVRTKALGGDTRPFGFNLNFGHPEDYRFEVHQVRPVRRPTSEGNPREDLLIQITQRRPGYFDEDQQRAEDERYFSIGQKQPPDKIPDFWYRGGATFILDLETFAVRYAIQKDVVKAHRRDQQREFLNAQRGTTLAELYFGPTAAGQRLAALHGPEH